MNEAHKGHSAGKVEVLYKMTDIHNGIRENSVWVLVHTIQNPARAAANVSWTSITQTVPSCFIQRVCVESVSNHTTIGRDELSQSLRWMGLRRASNAAQYEAEWVLPSFFKSLPEGNGCCWNRNHTKLSGRVVRNEPSDPSIHINHEALFCRPLSAESKVGTCPDK